MALNNEPIENVPLGEEVDDDAMDEVPLEPQANRRGSSANVIRSRVVEQLGLLDQIIPASRVLHGFNMVGEITKGEISLSVDMSDTVQNTKFHVIGGDMRYNALLGRPWIHSIRAVPSTLHQMMKFPTKDGITTIYGE
ncbi:PREDICTED: uncharacterized protein LOC109217405 [Nicotiana attenuata]|uniref:uncharacterized protein LOC109217405 n=1 Tax=Nicotiana attenuata TaxID=49451 RepID=UPI0009057FFD|nr:PREDICTED: uncharacterized protein LOC109217405 [Nicotiana attenuata]